MGRKEKLKLQRKEEQKEIEVVQKEKNKKGKVFAVLLLLLAVAAWQVNIAFNKNKENMQNDNQENTDEQKKDIGEAATESKTQKVVMETSRGNITLELYVDDAPKTVENFLKLSREGFYSGLKFHRVISDFMIQGGDPISRGEAGKDFVYDPSNNPGNLPVAGTGGPGYAFEDEINPWSLGLSESNISANESMGYVYRKDLNSHKNTVGALSMANSGPNTNGSQFFIITQQDQPHLNGKHTVFGQVVEGIEIVQGMQQGDEILKVNVTE